MIASVTEENRASVVQTVNRYLNFFEELKDDELLKNFVEGF